MTEISYLKNNVLLSRFLSILSIDILVKLSGFFLLPFFLRLMTQAEFGVYNYMLSIVQTFSLVLNLGLYVPLTKLYHSCPSSKQQGQLLFTIMSTLLIFLSLLLIIGVVSGADEWIIQTLFENNINYSKYKVLIVVGLAVSVLSFMLMNFFYTSEKIKQVRTYSVFRIVFVNTAALLALYFIKDDAVLTRLQFTYAIEFLLLLFFSHYYVKSMVFEFRKEILAKCMQIGLPIMVSALFGIVVNFSDKYLLQKYGTLVELSNYYLAFSFASIIPLIFASVQNAWLPMFMKEKDVQKNFKKTKGLLVKIFLIFLCLSVAVWVLFYVLLWTNVIPGKYHDVLWILPVLLVTQIFAALTTLLSNYLIYFEKTAFVIFSGLIVSCISIALGLWIIPIWGVIGAAITTFVVNLSYLIIDYYVVLFLKQKYLAAASITSLQNQ